MLLKIRNLQLKKRKGFTMLELMAVLGILAVLLALAWGFGDGDEYSRDIATKEDMKTIIGGIKLYQSMSVSGSVPANLGELVNGLSADQSKSGRAIPSFVDNQTWTNDSSTFRDHWDETYIYDPSGRTLTSNNNGGDPIIMTF